MNGTNTWLSYVLAALATWRVTHLLAEEDGPADLVLRLRLRLGMGWLGSWMDCFHCLSIWVAMPFAAIVAQSLMEWVLGWLALSGAACLFERIGGVREELPPQALEFPEDNDHVMLRSRSDGTEG
ncbi:MAG: hypothetical protein JSR16_07425 [Proteobacteria bacterium]|nr:hypothetical protein [Pseudomonadota bacterium]MBS0301982.1 hypothetical protein [Pseudomonadota bacterium]